MLLRKIVAPRRLLRSLRAVGGILICPSAIARCKKIKGSLTTALCKQCDQIDQGMVVVESPDIEVRLTFETPFEPELATQMLDPSNAMP